MARFFGTRVASLLTLLSTSVLTSACIPPGGAAPEVTAGPGVTRTPRVAPVYGVDIARESGSRGGY